MTDTEREIKRLISYIRSCRVANIDCTVTIDKNLTHGISNALEEIQKYREIGTVEECREAMEKQVPRKPDYEGDGYDDKGKLVYDIWSCPCCGKRYEVDYDDYEHCPKCGQAIDWSEEDETDDNID